MGDQAKSQPTEKEIEFYLCSFVEMSGAPKAKLVPATHLEEMKAEGAGFAGFAAGVSDIELRANSSMTITR